MTALTATYNELQSIFKAKAQADREKMAELVNKHLTSFGKEPITAEDDELVLFCKNCRKLRVCPENHCPASPLR